MEIALEELRRLRWELLVCNLLLLGGLLLLGRDLVLCCWAWRWATVQPRQILC